MTPNPPYPQPRPQEPRSFGSWTERAASYHGEQHPANARPQAQRPQPSGPGA